MMVKRRSMRQRFGSNHGRIARSCRNLSLLGMARKPVLSKDDEKNSHRGFGFIIFAEEISAEYASQKIDRILSQKITKNLHNLKPIRGSDPIYHDICFSGAGRWTPYGTTKYIICKQQVHQDSCYCHTCAYSKGVCAMCGKQIIDTKHYKQSNV